MLIAGAIFFVVWIDKLGLLFLVFGWFRFSARLALILR